MKRFHVHAQDPQGVAGEQFHTLGDMPVFSQSAATPARDYC
jgi:hypothetical protein